jgi:hypothetical protein
MNDGESHSNKKKMQGCSIVQVEQSNDPNSLPSHHHV